MNSFLFPEFLTLYRALPEQVRQQARQAHALFRQAPLIRGCDSAKSIPSD